MVDETPVVADPNDSSSPPLPCLTINLGRTKTTDADDGRSVVLIGKPADALRRWLREASIDKAPVFRAIDQWGNLKDRAMSPQSVNLVIKSRCKMAGLEPRQFSAHGLRLGYLTEAANHSSSRGDAAIAAQIGDAGRQLLQQCRTEIGPGGEIIRLALKAG